MKLIHTLGLATLLAATTSPALAQSGMDHSAHGAAHAPAKRGATGSGEGEIRRVDAENKRVAIKHGPIGGDINMMAMSMVFPVKDAKWLANLKPGDQVKFEVEQQGDLLVVTKLEVKR